MSVNGPGSRGDSHGCEVGLSGEGQPGIDSEGKTKLKKEDIAARPYYVFQKMENVIGGKLKLKKPLEGAIK